MELYFGFDSQFAGNVSENDILICGENFGCGSSREHPAVILRFVGVKAIVVKLVSRIFYRSAINQGLPIIVLPEAVNEFSKEKQVKIDLEKGKVTVGEKDFVFAPLPPKLTQILQAGGLVKSMSSEN